MTCPSGQRGTARGLELDGREESSGPGATTELKLYPRRKIDRARPTTTELKPAERVIDKPSAGPQLQGRQGPAYKLPDTPIIWTTREQSIRRPTIELKPRRCLPRDPQDRR